MRKNYLHDNAIATHLVGLCQKYAYLVLRELVKHNTTLIKSKVEVASTRYKLLVVVSKIQL